MFSLGVKLAYIIYALIFISILYGITVKMGTNKLYKYHKKNYFYRFSGWKYKVISNLFYDYPYHENLITIQTNKNRQKIPRLIRNFMNINDFKIEMERKRWVYRRSYYDFEIRGIKKFIPIKRVAPYHFINYKFTSKIKERIEFCVILLIISKISFMILAIPSNYNFSDLTKLGIKLPSFYVSKFPIPRKIFSRIIGYNDTVMQFKEAEPYFFSYSSFLVFKEFSKEEFESFNRLMKHAYFFEHVKDIEDFSEFNSLFQTSILSEKKYETPRILDPYTGKEITHDPYIYYFERSLTEGKVLRSLLMSFNYTFDFWGDLGRLLLNNFLSYLIWLQQIKIPITHSERNKFINNLYSILENFQINFKAYLELYNLTHYRLYEHREKNKKNDQSKGDPLGNYLNLLRTSIDFLNLLIQDRLKEHFTTKKTLIYSYTNDLQIKISYIKNKLEEENFKNCLRDFNEALNVYDEGRIAPIAVLRRVFECIVNIITKKIEGKKYGISKSLQILENKKILLDTPNNRSDTNLEKNLSYKLYGLLSYYGSHDNPYEPNITNILFYLTIYWIYLILKRYDT